MAKQVASVAGLQQLGQRFARLTEDMQTKVARSATNAAAQVVKKAAIEKAPKATGNVAKNVVVRRIRPERQDATETYVVTVRSGKGTKKQREAGYADAYYWRFLEFGTVKMPAQPFIRPAFDQSKTQAVEAMKRVLQARITRAERK